MMIDYKQEPDGYDRKRTHNSKYFTWVVQQGKRYEAILAQWYDDGYWTAVPKLTGKLDTLITSFNERVGLP